MSVFHSILTEYGIPWAFNRSLYSLRLKMFRTVGVSEKLFEKRADVRRVDLFEFDNDALKKFISELSSDDKTTLIQRADDAAEGKILGFSSVPLDYGAKIDWQKNPLTGVSCDSKKKWYRIADFDETRGDIKTVWEISRFSHFFLFTRAYLLTGEKKYFDAFSAQLHSWLCDNTYSFGANFKCGQECALRLLNTLMAYGVFSKEGLVDAAVENDVKELVSRCYRKILANFFYAYRCIKNNHTLSEIAGLIAGAWCCGDENRLRKAYAMFNAVSCEQFSHDGGYTQFSFTYQRFAMQIFECVSKMSAKTRLRLSAETISRYGASAYLMYECQGDGVDLPNYGSNDGALIFPATSCDYRDFRPVINTVFAKTKSRRVFERGKWDEELIWFGGFDAAVMPFARKSCAFERAGIFTLRGGEYFVMIVLNDYHTRPAHMDQLHIDIWKNGECILCDGGTYSYADALGRKLVLTRAHNTIAVNEREQMNKYSNFMVIDRTRRTGFSHTDSKFSGTYVSQNGYTHTRTVSLEKSGVSVCDEVSGGVEFVSLLHTPLKYRDGVFTSANGEAAVLSTGAAVSAEKSQRSLYYLRREDTNVIMLKGENTVVRFEII